MTDNAIITKDGATVGHLQESTATISDSGTINIPTSATYDINGTPHTHGGLSTYDSDVIMQDITTNNADSDNHGFLPKLSGDSDTYLDGAGTWGTPSGSGGGRTLISEATPSGTGTVTFSSIPGTYKKLTLEFAVRSSKASVIDAWILQFNSDTTASNYRYTELYVYAAGSTFAGGAANYYIISQGQGNTALSNAFMIGVIDIPQYANTNFFKEAIMKASYKRDNSTTYSLRAMTQLNWASTSAITDIVLKWAADNYVTNSVIRLYGEN